jgi:hypothetical protein
MFSYAGPPPEEQMSHRRPVSWLAEFSSPAFPALCASGVSDESIRLQLRGQPRLQDPILHRIPVSPLG